MPILARFARYASKLVVENECKQLYCTTASLAFWKAFVKIHPPVKSTLKDWGFRYGIGSVS
eukprot:scaffold110_cov315-Pavlova_lutheri.AAC.58